MGGSLAVTIKDPSGELHRMDRWTNPTKYVFTDPTFLSGDLVAIQDYLKTWYEMCAEYDNHDPEQGIGMAGVYCNPEWSSRDLLAPSEYGLVYIDFPNKLFWAMSSYASYRYLATDIVAWHTAPDDEHPDMMEYYASMFHTIIAVINRKTGESTPISFSTMAEFVAHAQDTKRISRKDAWLCYEIGMPPGWDRREYDPNQPGAWQFHDDLSTIYAFSDAENARWTENWLT